MRIGHGYDVHRTTLGRPLIIGGVEIPCEFGLAAHSDGDVLIHALADAILGGAGLRAVTFQTLIAPLSLKSQRWRPLSRK